MKAIDKIRLILGEEDFEKFKYNFNGCISDLDEFCEKNQGRVIVNAFPWECTIDEYLFWANLSFKLFRKWNSIEDIIIFPRVISKEEHDEIFRMFVLAYYGFIKIDEYSVTRFFEENSIMDRLYDALRSEE